MKRYHLCLGFVLGTVSWIQSAGAQSVTSEIQRQNPYSISYWGMVSGPSVGNPGLHQSDSISGKVDNTVPDNLYNQFKLDYNLDSKLTAGVVLNSLAQGDTIQPFLMRESGIRLGDKSILKIGAMNWSGDLRFLFPTSTRAHTSGVTSLVQTLQIISGSIARWDLGFVQLHTFRAYNETGGGKMLDSYISPYANYNFNDHVAATFALETYPQYFSGAYSMQGWNPAPMDVSVGAGFNVNPEININPVLIAYPDNLNLNTTAFAAYLSAKLI